MFAIVALPDKQESGQLLCLEGDSAFDDDESCENAQHEFTD